MSSEEMVQMWVTREEQRKLLIARNRVLYDEKISIRRKRLVHLEESDQQRRERNAANLAATKKGARDREMRVIQLRESGLSFAQVGREMGFGERRASYLFKRGKRLSTKA